MWKECERLIYSVAQNYQTIQTKRKNSEGGSDREKEKVGREREREGRER